MAAPVLALIWASDLVWSSLVMPVKLLFGIEGALFEAIRESVLQGFAITATLTVFLATLSSALP